MYWGWWISWSPFVGTFIARISKGRTIKEFILCVLILPALVTFLWFSAFGGTTMRDILLGDTAMIAAVNDNISTALYVFFDKFPLAMLLYRGINEDYNEEQRKEKLLERETYRKNILQLVNEEREEKNLKKIEPKKEPDKISNTTDL